jgi:hypothetical protein
MADDDEGWFLAGRRERGPEVPRRVLDGVRVDTESL